MADWVTLDTDTLLPGEPYTSAKALAMYENPIAIAEAADDAPRVVGPALNLFPLYRSGTTAKSVGPFPSVAKLFLLGFNLTASWNSGGAGVARLQIAFSTDGGSTFGAFQTIVTTPSVSSGDTGAFVAGTSILDIAAGVIVGTSTASFTPAPASTNAVRLAISSNTGGTSANGSYYLVNIGSEDAT